MTGAEILRCQLGGCTNPARWSPVLVMHAPARYEPCPELRASMKMAVCNVCKHQVRLDDLVSDEGWAQITMGVQLAGRVPPDRTRTTLDWQDIEAASALFRDLDRPIL